MPLMPSIVVYKCVVRHDELHVKQTTSFATSGLVSSSLSASSVNVPQQHIFFILVERPFPFFLPEEKNVVVSGHEIQTIAPTDEPAR